MTLPFSWFLAAVAAPAIIIASASVLRQRRAPSVRCEDDAPDLGQLLRQPTTRKRYILTSVLITLVLSIISGGAFYMLYRPRARIKQCAVHGADTLAVLERFKTQSRNLNSTLNASTSTPVQGFFDAGMLYAYGFDHIEASAMFTRACEEDKASTCSLCIWGKAYALGPFVNRVWTSFQQTAHCSFFGSR